MQQQQFLKHNKRLTVTSKMQHSRNANPILAADLNVILSVSNSKQLHQSHGVLKNFILTFLRHHEFLSQDLNKAMNHHVLKMCSSQLYEIFCTIFNLSFQSGVVPDIWKSSCIVPVPKNNKVGSMNDLRLVALTSVAFKTCERIVLPQLKSFILDSLDPFQFAYQSNRSCEDALLVTINEVTSHLDSKLSVKKNKVSGIITKSCNSARMMFFLFFFSFQHHSAAFAGQQNVIYVGPK